MQTFWNLIRDILEAIFARPAYTEDPATLPMNQPDPDVLGPWTTATGNRHNVRVIGDSFGMSVLQKDLLCDICSCESGFNPKARLVNSPTSIDRGLFQWNNLYHPDITDAMAYDPVQATKLACKAILNKQAHKLWSASEHCWNKTGKYDSLLYT